MNYNDVLNKIKLELKEDESNDFIYLINSLFNKYNISKNIDKIDDGIKFIYDIFDDKKEYIFHKINKSKT